MTTRNPFPASPLTGSNLMTGLNGRMKTLFNAAQFPLTSVGGTANAVTATLAPALDSDGFLDGMTFTLTWGAANTAGVTLAINGGSPVPVLGPDGLALPDDSIGDGLRSQITYSGGDFVMLSPTLRSGGAGGVRYSFTFTASGTWTKPVALPDATPVTIQLWAGGGGGNAHAGGGGGSSVTRIIRAGDLGATATITIGAGGAVGAAGGNSLFGSVLTAYGGAAGSGTALNPVDGGGPVGGGGGGELAAGSVDTGGAAGGGSGGVNAVGGPAGTIFGGGGGGVAAGGAAVYGGGGGTRFGAGGASAYGGNGGANNTSGSAPSGGGGRSASGARGECRVWI